MHITALALTLLSASALTEPIPQPADAALDKRADNWCRVLENVNCRKGPWQAVRRGPGGRRGIHLSLKEIRSAVYEGGWQRRRG